MWLRTRAEKDENPGGQTGKAKVNRLAGTPVSGRADRRRKKANDGEVNTR